VPLDAILPKIVTKLARVFAIDVLEDEQSHGKSPPMQRCRSLLA
jgi:hypothetical protein